MSAVPFCLTAYFRSTVAVRFAMAAGITDNGLLEQEQRRLEATKRAREKEVTKFLQQEMLR